ncbi:MAG: hypothetical protein IPI07_04115 [Flavobacteriales bacterium]|nr:hypothetical protein [Flavobacteriales bacterium]
MADESLLATITTPSGLSSCQRFAVIIKLGRAGLFKARRSPSHWLSKQDPWQMGVFSESRLVDRCGSPSL